MGWPLIQDEFVRDYVFDIFFSETFYFLKLISLRYLTWKEMALKISEKHLTLFVGWPMIQDYFDRDYAFDLFFPETFYFHKLISLRYLTWEEMGLKISKNTLPCLRDDSLHKMILSEISFLTFSETFSSPELISLRTYM